MNQSNISEGSSFDVSWPV